jgi:hypothetical protein
MRNVAIQQAFDVAAYDADIRAGRGAQYLHEFNRMGIVWAHQGGVQLMASDIALRAAANDGAPWGIDLQPVMDAQPDLVLNQNAGIPSFFTNWVDPRVIRALVSPMNAAKILGETKKGDWITTVAYFPNVEHTGETQAYGDYDQGGSTGVNANFPQRQAFHYQTWTQWGERELARAGAAGIDWAAEMNAASVLTLMKFQNKSYFFGIDGLQCYGLLNDPNLYTPIAPTAQWNLAGTTAQSIYEDIRRMYAQMQFQSNGTVSMDSPMVLAMSNTIAPALNKIADFGFSVKQQLQANFPNMRFETAPEYTTASGDLVQLIVDSIEGVETATCAFTEKLRLHNIETYTSYWRQKKSQGTFGTVIYRYVGIVQMLGV